VRCENKFFVREISSNDESSNLNVLAMSPLTPGFSPETKVETNGNRFNGFLPHMPQTVETVLSSRLSRTRLKPGVNEINIV
jgi:hypothetical protein